MTARRICAALLLLVFAPLPANADGKTQYETLCGGCHLPTGEGVASMFPPLAKRLAPWLAEPDGRNYVMQVVTNGRFGDLVVDGATYSGFMPTFSHLSDSDLADILNYVATTLNTPAEGFEPFTAETLAEARKAPVRDAALTELRGKLP